MNSVMLAASMDGSKVLDLGSTLFVAGLGIVVVFLGLICIVAICKLMSLFFKNSNDSAPAPASVAATPAVSASNDIPEAKRGEFIAAVSAAIAEDLGTDVDAIKITSVKKI